MSSTTTQPNNARIKFRGCKEREMAKTTMPGEVDPKMPRGSSKTPIAARGSSKTPIAAKIQGPKKPSRRLRKQARHAAKRGLISPKR